MNRVGRGRHVWASLLYVAVVLCVFSSSPIAFAAGWICTYPDFSAERIPVIARLNIESDVLVFSSPAAELKFKIMTNNNYGLIAVETYSRMEENKPRIFSSAILVDKILGRFLYVVAEMGQSPRSRDGRCISG
jgi:hypothetical protein